MYACKTLGMQLMNGTRAFAYPGDPGTILGVGRVDCSSAATESKTIDCLCCGSPVGLKFALPVPIRMRELVCLPCGMVRIRTNNRWILYGIMMRKD